MWVKGSGGDLGTLTPAGLAVLRLDRLRALVDVYPGVDREDEMVAAFDFCLHGKGGRRAVHRHRHARPGAGAARGSPAPGLRHRAGGRGGRGGADPAVLRRPGGVGAVAAARLPARPGHRRHRRGQPAGHRGHPGRARHHRVGRDQRRVRGPLAGDHPHRGGVHRGEREAGPVRPGHRGLRAAARSRPARPRGGTGPADPGPGLDRPPAGRALHRLPRRAGLPGPGQAPGAGRARHLVPGSLPAHQGAADAARPAAGRLLPGGRGPAARAARGLP